MEKTKFEKTQENIQGCADSSFKFGCGLTTLVFIVILLLIALGAL